MNTAIHIGLGRTDEKIEINREPINDEEYFEIACMTGGYSAAKLTVFGTQSQLDAFIDEIASHRSKP